MEGSACLNILSGPRVGLTRGPRLLRPILDGGPLNILSGPRVGPARGPRLLRPILDAGPLNLVSGPRAGPTPFAVHMPYIETEASLAGSFNYL